MPSKQIPKKRKTPATESGSDFKRACKHSSQDFAEARESTEVLPTYGSTAPYVALKLHCLSVDQTPNSQEFTLSRLPQSPMLLTSPTNRERLHLRSLQKRMDELLIQMQQKSAKSEAETSTEVRYLLDLAVLRLQNQVRTYNVLVSRNVQLNRHIQHLECLDNYNCK